MATTVFTPSAGVLNGNDTNPNTSFRVRCVLTAASSGKLQVTFTASTATGLTASNASIGKWDGTNNPFTTTTPVELKFGGASGFSISAGGSITSDLTDHSAAFSLALGESVLVDLDCTSPSGQRYRGSNSNVDTWYALGATGYNLPTPAGYSKLAGVDYAVEKVETDSGGGGQSITGSLFTNSNSFYGATVGRGAVNISGALYSDTDTFYTATLGKTYAITGSRFDNSAQFYAATVAPGTVTISGALFTDGDTFYAATIGRGAVNIVGSLYTDPDSFYAASVSQAGSPQNIDGALFSNSSTFHGATVSASYEITGALYSDGDTFYSAAVTQPGSSPAWVAWANVAASTASTSVAPVIPTGSMGDLLILSAGCIGSNTAFVITKSGADDWSLIADFNVGANRVGFWWKRKEASETAPTVSNAGRTSTNLLTSAIDSYTGILGSGDPIINVSQVTETSGAIVGPALTTTRNNSLAVTRFMRLGANTASAPASPWIEDRDNGTSGGGGARFYGDSQVVLTPSSVTASNRGGSGANFGAVAFEIVSEPAAEQVIAGGLFSNSNAFYAATIAASYTIGGALYTDADTFFAASISQPNAPQTITGQLYANDNQFFAGVVTGGQTEQARQHGGFYPKPVIYVDKHGRPVDLKTYKARAVNEAAQIAKPVIAELPKEERPIAREIVAALRKAVRDKEDGRIATEASRLSALLADADTRLAQILFDLEQAARQQAIDDDELAAILLLAA